jgi:hypothetical protein
MFTLLPVELGCLIERLRRRASSRTEYIMRLPIVSMAAGTLAVRIARLGGRC